ncbi:cysteine-tryptophan domain-containing zinc finger protein 7-like isoform X1 [Zingiber officinale]|uniref:cysteine-tryptophan domain-containing zinc finger protein 7-like isoform X1 n=1 Tax=Zingiber officinale TaxID=94328 RepID=UPI001C4D5319|nr:cysteine-tryptophan domain-containing zinc finger protein 7-like isoform X1 [Zingiber officinale]
MEEDNDVEESEAWSGEEADRFIDPDALCYIDEKLQNVLGHFQKEFEAGVSAENLGAKFGGYGSFLPTYQRSPKILCHRTNPHKVEMQTVTKSSCNMPVKVTNPKTSVTLSSSLPKSNAAAVSLEENSCKQDTCLSNPSIQDPNLLQTSFSKTTNGSDHKSLKLRIKVGPDNNLARNNAALYNGLDFYISPSSSEDSPDGNNGICPELQDGSDESPMTILQVMTCSPAPDVHLLSPLQDCFCQLIEKDLSVRKQSKIGKSSKGRSEISADFTGFTIHSRELNGQPEKPTKLSQPNGRKGETKYLEGKGIIDRVTRAELQAEQGLAYNSFNRVSSVSENTRKAHGQINENIIKTEINPLDQFMKLKMASSTDKPIADSAKDNIELVDCTINHQAGYSSNKTNQLKGELSEKTSITARALENQNANNQKDREFDMQRERRNKIDKDSDFPNTDSTGEKRRNEHSVEATDNIKLTSSPSRERILQWKEQIADKKRKVISQTNSIEVMKDNLSGSSSATIKQKKKNTYAKANHVENKSKGLKSHKGLNRSSIKEFHANKNCDVKYDENGAPSSNHLKTKNKAMKRKHEESIVLSQPLKERSGGKNIEKDAVSGLSASEPVPVPLACNAPAIDATIAPQVPVVIEENWVACDICQKWRLLPYWTNPRDLPGNWQCSLLNWLPRMNSCHVSEDDTTNALHALYAAAPASENIASLDGRKLSAASTPLARGDHLGVPAIVKKKSAQKDASNILNQSISIEFPNVVKKDNEFTVKCKSVNDTNQCLPAEANLLTKGGIDTLGSSTGFRTQMHKSKKKDKQENHECHSHGGELSRKNEKHPKAKVKRMTDQDDLRASKKHKNEILQNSECNIKDYPSTLSNEAHDDVWFPTNFETNEHFSASDIKSLSAKEKVDWQDSQRKVLVTSQHGDNTVIAKETFGQPDYCPDKNADLSVSRGKRCKITKHNNKMEKKLTTKMVLATCGAPSELDKANEAINFVEKKYHNLEFDFSKRDFKKSDASSVQPVVAANSSSSKVSSSRRSRSNLPEAKGSPVESVSSSPLRVSSRENQSCKRNSDKKYDMINADYSALGSPRRCSDIEVNGGYRHAKSREEMGAYIKKQSLDNHRATNTGILDSSMETVDHLVKVRTQSTAGRSDEKMLVKQGVHDKRLPIEHGENVYKDDYQDMMKVNKHCEGIDSTQPKPSKNSSGFNEKHRGSKSNSCENGLKVSGFHTDLKNLKPPSNTKSYRHKLTTGSCKDENDDLHEKSAKDVLLKKEHSSRWMTALQDNMDVNGSSMLPNQQRNLDSKIHEKSMDQHGSSKIHKPALLARQVNSKFKLSLGNKQETRGLDLSPLKAHISNVDIDETVKYDASKVVKQHKHPNNYSGLCHNNMRHDTPNGPDASSPIRKENYSILIKEARDLKHTANRLKNEGLELESLSLFFEAALKFLYIAARMEFVNFDCAKLAEQMYFDTAKLCKFVAREYEKIKDMAAAALAYKCIEVAYLKSAYCKNPNVSRDRHELQTALQLLPPGHGEEEDKREEEKNTARRRRVAPSPSPRYFLPPPPPSLSCASARYEFFFRLFCFSILHKEIFFFSSSVVTFLLYLFFVFFNFSSFLHLLLFFSLFWYLLFFIFFFVFSSLLSCWFVFVLLSDFVCLLLLFFSFL